MDRTISRRSSNDDHSRGLAWTPRGFEERKQAIGQRKAAHVVDGKIRLNTLLGQYTSATHDSRAVNQVVQRRPSSCDFVRQAVSFPHQTQVCLQELDIAVIGSFAKLSRRSRALFMVSADDDYSHTAAGKSTGDLLPDSVRTTGDDCALLQRD